MNKINITNPYELQKVVLAPILDEMQLDENLEPPFVRLRETNSQYVHIDLSSSNLNTDPASSVIPLDRSLPRVNRISIELALCKHLSPNINPRNNRFAFVKGGVPYTAIIPADQNLTGLARYVALAAAMNVAVGGPPDFQALPGVYPNTYTINAAITNTPWRFDNSSNGVSRGRYLWGINPNNYNPGTEQAIHTLHSATENYTRYIDFASYELTQYTKIDISGVRMPAETLYRLYTLDVAYGQTLIGSPGSPPSLNYDRSRNLASIDMNLLDEFGLPIYIPQVLWPNYIMYVVLIAFM